VIPQKWTARLRLTLGLAKTGYAIALFPLAALLKKFHPFKPFQNIPLGS
jgi:hypothetical protein